MTKQGRSLPKIARFQSLEEQAYLHIKEAILNGTFPPGEYLAELQLAQDLGISRTPIRQAMARLQEERFLINVPFKGYYVAEISIEDIREIYELRQILECYVVRETAQQFTPAELDEIEASVQAAVTAFEQGDHINYIAHNRKFHHAFPQKYGNRRILRLLINLDEHIQRILIHQLQSGHTDLLSPRDHQLILAAIRAGDVELAVGLMRDHLMGFREATSAQNRDTEQD